MGKHRIDSMPKDFDMVRYRKINPDMSKHQIGRIKLINKLAKGIKGKVLDYGCGYGDITYNISHNFDEIIGVDILENRINWAKEEFSPIKFHLCDETRLSYDDSTFDAVISSVVICWVDNAEAYLKESQRVLKKGGVLILMTTGFRIGKRLKKMFNKSIEEDYFYEDYKSFVLRLKRFGFKIEASLPFYTSFSESYHSPKELLIRIIELPFRLFRFKQHAPLFIIKAIKE